MRNSNYTKDVISGLSVIGFVFLTVLALVYGNIPCLIAAAVCFVILVWIGTKEIKENARQLNEGKIKLKP